MGRSFWMRRYPLIAAHSCSTPSRTWASRMEASLPRKTAPTASSMTQKKSAYPTLRRNRSERVMRRISRPGDKLPLPFGRGLARLGLGGRLVRRLDHVADATHGLNEFLRIPVVDFAAQKLIQTVRGIGY